MLGTPVMHIFLKCLMEQEGLIEVYFAFAFTWPAVYYSNYRVLNILCFNNVLCKKTSLSVVLHDVNTRTDLFLALVYLRRRIGQKSKEEKRFFKKIYLEKLLIILQSWAFPCAFLFQFLSH